jgi:hypothetical protein
MNSNTVAKEIYADDNKVIMILMDQRAVDLADAFVRNLRNTLTAEQWDQMKELNAQYGEGRVCASYEFCDANLAMALAFKALRIPLWRDADENGDPTEKTLRNPETAMLHEANALWNSAWEYARKTKMTA